MWSILVTTQDYLTKCRPTDTYIVYDCPLASATEISSWSEALCWSGTCTQVLRGQDCKQPIICQPSKADPKEATSSFLHTKHQISLKRSVKFKMNLWGHRFSQNANQKFCPTLYLINFQPRNPSNFWLAFWKKRWPHNFILNLTDL